MPPAQAMREPSRQQPPLAAAAAVVHVASTCSQAYEWFDNVAVHISAQACGAGVVPRLRVNSHHLESHEPVHVLAHAKVAPDPSLLVRSQLTAGELLPQRIHCSPLRFTSL
jgi:hypothetical protein